MDYLIKDEKLELKYEQGKGAWTYHIGFCTKESITGKLLTSKDCITSVIDHYKTSKPLIDFVNKAIESGDKSPFASSPK